MTEKEKKELEKEKPEEVSSSSSVSDDVTLRAMTRLVGVCFALLFASMFLDWAGDMCVRAQLRPHQDFISKLLCIPIIAITGADARIEHQLEEEEEWLMRREPTSLAVQRRSRQSFHLTPWSMKVIRGVLLLGAFGCCAWVVWLWVRPEFSEEDVEAEEEEG